MQSLLTRHRKATVGRLLFFYTAFSIFANSINPITPSIFLELEFPDYMFGVGYAAMSGACFLLSPLWGKLCDRYGYSRILGSGFLLYAMVQALFSVSTTQPVIIFCRFMGGVANSACMVATLAYLMAVASGEEKHRFMLYYSVATTAGMAIGYAVGGFIGTVSIQLTFYVQITALLFFCVALFFTLKDPEQRPGTEVQPDRPDTPRAGPLEIVTPMFFITVFLASFATTGYDNAYNYYVKEALNFPNYYNGLIRAGIGVITFLVSFTVGSRLARGHDLRRSLVPVLVLCGAVACGVCLLDDAFLFVMGNFGFYAFNALCLPFQQGILSDASREGDSGYISGVFNSFLYGGKVLGALFAGFVYSFDSKLPFLAAAAVFLISAVFGFADYAARRSGRVPHSRTLAGMALYKHREEES